MKRLGEILLLVVLSPLILSVGLAALVCAIPAFLAEEQRVRAFRRRNDGEVILVGSQRRGWHDFLRNNLLPVLPDGARAVWSRAERGGRDSRFVGALRHAGIPGTAKPYLVLVTRERLLARSLNHDLQEWKKRPAKSEEARRACAGVVGRALAELREHP